MNAPQARPHTPDWVVQPVGMDGAALALGVSRRTLSDLLKEHPHYERRGNRYVFYPEHIKRLRFELRLPAPDTGAVSDGKRRPIRATTIASILKRDGRRCVYCQEDVTNFEIDHLHPISQGGDDTAKNLVVSCRRCNRQKGSKTLEDYLAWRRERGLPVFEVKT